MHFKLKTLSLGLLAAAACSVVAPTSAPATAGGHFVTDLPHTLIHTFDGFGHNLHFIQHGISGEVGCKQATHSGTLTSETVTELPLTPEYKECYTTPSGAPGSVSIDTAGCTYNFTVAAGTTADTEQTMHVACTVGAAIRITHPNCTIAISPQTVNGGITYTTADGPPDYITLDLNAQLSSTIHGLCQFVAPTNSTTTLKGALRVKAINPKEQKEGRSLKAT